VRVVGVDGCRGGWVAVAYDAEAGTLSPRVHPYFAEVLSAYPDAACIGVDIPIGLSEDEPRCCDRAARKVLGKKGPSVFPAPDLRVVTAPTYEKALALSRSLTGKGMSIMAYSIYAKVAEVNRVMTPSLQERVVEVHPELGFWALAGYQPVMSKKRKPDGYRDRRDLLTAALGVEIPDRAAAFKLQRPAKPDDILDAIVAAWCARRWAEGIAERLPPVPPRDIRGLRMEIVY